MKTLIPHNPETITVNTRIQKFKSKTPGNVILAKNPPFIEESGHSFYQSSYLQVVLDTNNMTINIKTLTNNVNEFMLIKDFFLQIEKNFYRFVLSYSNLNQLKKRFDEISQGNEFMREIFLDTDQNPNKYFNHIYIYEHLFPELCKDIYQKFQTLHVIERKTHNRNHSKNRISNIVNMQMNSNKKRHFFKRSTLNHAINNALVSNLVNVRHKKSILNIFEYKSPSAFFKEKNQVIRNEYYGNEYLSQMDLQTFPLESEFTSTIFKKLRSIWGVDKLPVDFFKEKIKQLYIFNTKLLENYFEIKFNSLAHLCHSIQDKKVLLRNLQGKILKEFFYSGELERNNFKDIIGKIKSFDFYKTDFNFVTNQSLKEYNSKTPVLFYYMKKLSDFSKNNSMLSN